MTVQVEVWHLVTLAVTLFGGYWALIKLMATQAGRQMDDRFAVISNRLTGIEKTTRDDVGQWQRVERELLSLKADMPLHYVRREDYIRGQSVIEAKLDGLAVKLENVQLRSAAGAPHVL